MAMGSIACVDEENMELVVEIIDFRCQYDILKPMEHVGKSLPIWLFDANSKPMHAHLFYLECF
jgi:hypothetical protein